MQKNLLFLITFSLTLMIIGGCDFIFGPRSQEPTSHYDIFYNEAFGEFPKVNPENYIALKVSSRTENIIWYYFIVDSLFTKKVYHTGDTPNRVEPAESYPAVTFNSMIGLVNDIDTGFHEPCLDEDDCGYICELISKRPNDPEVRLSTFQSICFGRKNVNTFLISLFKNKKNRFYPHTYLYDISKDSSYVTFEIINETYDYSDSFKILNGQEINRLLPSSRFSYSHGLLKKKDSLKIGEFRDFLIDGSIVDFEISCIRNTSGEWVPSLHSEKSDILFLPKAEYEYINPKTDCAKLNFPTQ